MRRAVALCSASLFAFVTGCSSPDAGSRATPLPPLAAAKLTTEARLEQVNPIDGAASRPPGVPSNLAAMLAEGFGARASVFGNTRSGCH
jgi:hypothetical protein